MTKEEFRDIVVPFLHFYWDRTRYYFILDNTDGVVRVGNMVLFCSTFYIPDVFLIVDGCDKVIDGYAIGRDHLWNGRSAREQLREIGVRLEDEE